MFSLALSRRIIQGPVVRSWNSITHFANLLWGKFNHATNSSSAMPRPRRPYHSRPRSRSRSHSYDRDRDRKRRRLDSSSSSPYRKSISPELGEDEVEKNVTNMELGCFDDRKEGFDSARQEKMQSKCDNTEGVSIENQSDIEESSMGEEKNTERSLNNHTEEDISKQNDSITVDLEVAHESNTSLECTKPVIKDCKILIENSSLIETYISKLSGEAKDTDKLSKTPKKPLTPAQKKKQELREMKIAERQERFKEKLVNKTVKLKAKEEKQKIKQEQLELKQKEKQEKMEIKQKEIEDKQKEKEIKEEKRKKELEEKEQKRKEKEEKEQLKRKELEGKQKEKQKQEEKKQKVAAMFANFFTKKADNILEDKKCDELAKASFMPFKVKSDMKLAPVYRRLLSEAEKTDLDSVLQNGTELLLYLKELKCGKIIGRASKTWPYEGLEDEDVIIIDDANIGESINDVDKIQKFRAKFFKFHENRRPPYFGTWRKQSKVIKPRNPFAADPESFEYDIESDDEWEEEDSCGESLHGSEDDEKEIEGDNEYEVDNDFFVPHGHLSDDEVDEDDTESPEAHKAKLRLLKKAFDEERKDKTHKIKARIIGCIWEKKLQNNLDDAIHEFLKPFAIISNGPVYIKKRSEFVQVPTRKSGVPGKPIDAELLATFLKFIHGRTNNMLFLINEFLGDLSCKGINTDVSKTSIKQEVRKCAEWMRNPDSGLLYNKFCWYVHKDAQEKYNLDLSSSKIQK